MEEQVNLEDKRLAASLQVAMQCQEPPAERDLAPPLARLAGTLSASVVERRPPIAPWWHTFLLVGLLTAASVVGATRHGVASRAANHFRIYSFSILWEWVLAGVAYWGIRMRRVPLRRLLGERRPGTKAWFADLKMALAVWLTFLPVVGIINGTASLIQKHMSSTANHKGLGGSSQDDERGAPRPTESETVRKRIVRLAPQSGGEMVLWIVLSISAGICEEFIFRGYLQQQFASLNGRLWTGVACSALIFGGAHGYEGVGGMISIAALGAVFSTLAVRRRGVRSSMMMHAWYDIFAGGVLFILKHAHRI